jgi:hypothetical protein
MASHLIDQHFYLLRSMKSGSSLQGPLLQRLSTFTSIDSKPYSEEILLAKSGSKGKSLRTMIEGDLKVICQAEKLKCATLND